MRTLLVVLALVISMPILGLVVIVASLLGVKDGPGSVYDVLPRIWCRLGLFAAGVRVVLHNEERMLTGEPRIFVSNHVSWFDVFTLAGTLRRYKFVGKAELFRIPIFGAAARACGMIPIVRENLKAAFASYELAGRRIQDGASVVVFPEGTRGTTYGLRPFKKGPFVLASAAGVPIVPTIVHGTIDIFPKGSWRVRSGTVHVHFLEEISTAGRTYEDRDELAKQCWERMAEALKREYRVDSVLPARRARGVRAAALEEA
jgi:1-acyl-sn-glycerol-3-phosphate acyltransferase